MNIEVIWPKKSPLFRRDYCMECFGPVKHAARGRPRTFCSAACRQRRYRDKTNFRSRAYRLHKEDRAAERVLRQYERAKGRRIDDVTPIIPGSRVTRRYHLTFGLRERQRLEYCLWCGIPILRETYGPGARLRCCSALCSHKFGKFVRHMNIAVLHYRDSLDPVVKQRLRMYNFKTKRILPPIRSKVGLCDHCHKPFAATHPARKYCCKKCRQNAWYAAQKTCRFCKRRFRPATNMTTVQKYCSTYCKERGHRLPPLAIPRECLECGKPFVANRRSYTKKKYCSDRCRHIVAMRKYHARKREQKRMQNEICHRQISEVRMQK